MLIVYSHSYIVNDSIECLWTWKTRKWRTLLKTRVRCNQIHVVDICHGEKAVITDPVELDARVFCNGLMAQATAKRCYDVGCIIIASKTWNSQGQYCL